MSELVDFLDCRVHVLIVVVEDCTLFEGLEVIAEANDGKLASLGEAAHEEHTGLFGDIHPVLHAHAATAVHDEDEMEF